MWWAGSVEEVKVVSDEVVPKSSKQKQNTSFLQGEPSTTALRIPTDEHHVSMSSQSKVTTTNVGKDHL